MKIQYVLNIYTFFEQCYISRSAINNKYIIKEKLPTIFYIKSNLN